MNNVFTRSTRRQTEALLDQESWCSLEKLWAGTLHVLDMGFNGESPYSDLGLSKSALLLLYFNSPDPRRFCCSLCPDNDCSHWLLIERFPLRTSQLELLIPCDCREFILAIIVATFCGELPHSSCKLETNQLLATDSEV